MAETGGQPEPFPPERGPSTLEQTLGWRQESLHRLFMVHWNVGEWAIATKRKCYIAGVTHHNG